MSTTNEGASGVSADKRFLEALITKNGELISGAALWRALGYRSERSFHRAVVSDRLPVRVFSLPGRRGRYARTRDVAHWLGTLGEEERVCN